MNKYGNTQTKSAQIRENYYKYKSSKSALKKSYNHASRTLYARRVGACICSATVLALTSVASNLIFAEKILARSATQEDRAEEKIEKDSNKPPTTSISYPMLINKSALLDLATGATYPAVISSEDSLTPFKVEYIQSKEQESKSKIIDSSNILSWSVGNYTEQKFSFANAASGTLGFAAGALIIPSPATPLLLLMSPLMGGISGATSVDPKWRIALQLINEEGREETILIQFFTEEDVSLFGNYIEDKTSLNAGVKRSLSEISELQKDRLFALINKRNKLAAKLSKVNRRKPWCSVLDLSGTTGDPNEYNSVNDKVKQLSQRLSIDVSQHKLDVSNSELWERHLAANPNIKIWAEANPQAAAKLKECPSL